MGQVVTISRSDPSRFDMFTDYIREANMTIKAMGTRDYAEIRVNGRSISIPSARICGRTVIVTGNRLKVAAVQDEELVQGEVVDNLDRFIADLKESALKADIFTFAQHLPDVTPKYGYHLEWDSDAVIPITTFREWLEGRVEYDVRKAVKRAAKRGVIAKAVEFNDDLVHGIKAIYDESPVRQGKPFWHYGKNFETIRKEKATYLDRSEFIGAYYEDKLIGFIKMVYVDGIARTLHVISGKKHSDKKPTNALIAKAVEVCEQKGRTHLVYGEYAHGQSGHQRFTTSKTEFKRRNGFEEFLVPRYYIPLTAKGRLCLKLRLHHGLKGALPRSVLTALRNARWTFYKCLAPRRSRVEEEGAD